MFKEYEDVDSACRLLNGMKDWFSDHDKHEDVVILVKSFEDQSEADQFMQIAADYNKFHFGKSVTPSECTCRWCVDEIDDDPCFDFLQ